MDCFDALTSDRPYRPRMEDRDALQILSDRRGTMYDPRVVDTFFALHGSGIDMAPAPPPADQRALGAADAARDVGDDRREARPPDILRSGTGAGARRPRCRELGEILWSQFRTASARVDVRALRL